MTQQSVETGANALARDTAPHETNSTINIERLVADIFAKVAAAQRDVLRARAVRDERSMEERLLYLRGSALLLACLPVDPDSNAYRLKVLAAVTLREEDGEEASHAWLMIERALVLDQQRHASPVAHGG